MKSRAYGWMVYSWVVVVATTIASAVVGGNLFAEQYTYHSVFNGGAAFGMGLVAFLSTLPLVGIFHTLAGSDEDDNSST